MHLNITLFLLLLENFEWLEWPETKSWSDPGKPLNLTLLQYTYTYIHIIHNTHKYEKRCVSTNEVIVNSMYLYNSPVPYNVQSL